jgi:hemoglobin
MPRHRANVILVIVVGIAALAMPGCGNPEQKDRDFFTSGSREADQRAEQRVAKVEQLRGEGEDGKDEKKGDPKKIPGAQQADAQKSLYERLGGEEGMVAIVEDFVPRVLADPRVNWERKGITRGGMNLLKRGQSVEWKATPENVERLKKHLAQFLALSTGGPSTYDGRDMKQVHQGLHVTNAEFDASIGDLKATLDKLGIANEEQKELLSIVETTRPQIASQR